MLTTDELNRLFVVENFPNEKLFLFFLLCVSCGLRLGEVRAIKLKQIFFSKKALLVDGFCKKDGTRTNYNKKGSASNPRFRIVLIPRSTLLKLLEYINNNLLGLDDFVFTENNKPLRQEYAEDVFLKALIKANIALSIEEMKKSGVYKKGKFLSKKSVIPDGRKLVPHSLRYTYVTRMRRELPADTVMKMVGHLDVQMTNYYTDNTAIEESIAGLAGANTAVDNLFF